MAKNLNYKKNKTTSLTVKGLLNAEGTEVTYIDDNKEEQTIMVSTIMEQFRDKAVNIAIKEVVDEELEIEE